VPRALPRESKGTQQIDCSPSRSNNSPAAGEIDPAKLAAPRDPEIVKAASRLPVNDAPFILGAEDQIQIMVLNGPEFSGSHMIRPDGKITINLVGEVKASGVTPEELGSVLKEKLKKYIVEPDVNVQVTAIRSRRFYIQGEVMRPGAFPLEPKMTVSQALSLGGGLTPKGTLRGIVIERHDANGKSEEIAVKMTDAVLKDDVLIFQERLF